MYDQVSRASWKQYLVQGFQRNRVYRRNFTVTKSISRKRCDLSLAMKVGYGFEWSWIMWKSTAWRMSYCGKQETLVRCYQSQTSTGQWVYLNHTAGKRTRGWVCVGSIYPRSAPCPSSALICPSVSQALVSAGFCVPLLSGRTGRWLWIRRRKNSSYFSPLLHCPGHCLHNGHLSVK